MTFSGVGLNFGRMNFITQSVTSGNAAAITKNMNIGP
jgi:hypothetical protein